MTAKTNFRTLSLREAAQHAMNALGNSKGYIRAAADGETLLGWGMQLDLNDIASSALRAALALPDAEPVAWTLTETLDKRETTVKGYLWFKNPVNACWSPLYAAPQPTEPKAVERVPLTKDEIFQSYMDGPLDLDLHAYELEALARGIEAAHGIKGAA